MAEISASERIGVEEGSAGRNEVWNSMPEKQQAKRPQAERKR